jgi:hypothetical protein
MRGFARADLIRHELDAAFHEINCPVRDGHVALRQEILRSCTSTCVTSEVFSSVSYSPLSSFGPSGRRAGCVSVCELRNISGMRQTRLEVILAFIGFRVMFVYPLTVALRVPLILLLGVRAGTIAIRFAPQVLCSNRFYFVLNLFTF